MSDVLESSIEARGNVENKTPDNLVSPSSIVPEELKSNLFAVDEKTFYRMKNEIEFEFVCEFWSYDDKYDHRGSQEAEDLWREVFSKLTYFGWSEWVYLNFEEIAKIATTLNGSFEDIVKCSMCSCVTQVFSPYYRLQQETEFRIDAGISYGCGNPVRIVDTLFEG
jgi:hypothetical protein